MGDGKDEKGSAVARLGEYFGLGYLEVADS